MPSFGTTGCQGPATTLAEPEEEEKKKDEDEMRDGCGGRVVVLQY
jgi:hypothetical protein